MSCPLIFFDSSFPHKEAVLSSVIYRGVRVLSLTRLCQLTDIYVQRDIVAEMTGHWRSLLLESLTGIEPAHPAWKAGVLPLNYNDICGRVRDTTSPLVQLIPRKHTFRTPYVHVNTGDSFVFKSASGKGPVVAVTFCPRTANRRA